MVATLYIPHELPRIVPTEGLSLPAPPQHCAQVSHEVAALLGCAQGLVDVLDCGPGYAAYSIFDFEGDNNQLAMDALTAVSTHHYDVNDEEHTLQGPVLLVTAN